MNEDTVRLKTNEMNQAAKGTVILQEGGPATYVCMLVKGRVESVCANGRIQLGVGSFLGLNELYQGEYENTYIALEDSSLYVFGVEDETGILKILSMNKDYKGLSFYYLNRVIYEVNKIYVDMKAAVEKYAAFAKEQYTTYLEECRKEGFRAIALPGVSRLNSIEEYEEKLNSRLVSYYMDSLHISLDVVKPYFANSEAMILFHLEEQSVVIRQLYYECGMMTDVLENIYKTLVDEEAPNLIKGLALFANEIKRAGGNVKETVKRMDKVLEAADELKNIIGEKTSRESWNSGNSAETLRDSIAGGGTGAMDKEEVKSFSVSITEQVASLKDTMQQIFDFAGMPDEAADELRAQVKTFIELKDRNSTDDSMRRLRKGIEKNYYILYEKAFAESLIQPELPRSVELFLDYGLLDERLLSEEQLMELCSLSYGEDDGPCKVYSMREWIKEIYDGEKDPSRNDLGVDFMEYLRGLKKANRINAELEQQYKVDSVMRSNYEIMNMFASGSRVVNGQISVFVPMLYREQFYNSVTKMAVTKRLVNEIVSKLLQVDFSVFHREYLYMNPELGIEREYIMKQVFPDIILCPVVGMNGAMWQEISGKRRDSAGRLIIPAFCSTSLEGIMVKLFGQFRWELCKTMQGVNWNNVQIKSLTAEYVDYIQFYRKNRLLSEERKEKVKLQIQRGRNSSREIFVIDYEAWINNEANGSIRLNKVAREILSTYCPLKKQLREGLGKQPIYEEAFARYGRECLKKIHELDVRYRMLEKTMTLPEELARNMSFYKDM